MALFNEESEDFRIDEVFSLGREDTEEQTETNMEEHGLGSGYSKKNDAICAGNKRKQSGKENKLCPPKRVTRSSLLAKKNIKYSKSPVMLINRRCPAKVSIPKEQLLKLTQRILNLEGRVGWLEARLNEKVVPSPPSTADQSTSTDANPPMEIQKEIKPPCASPSSIHESSEDQSTSVSLALVPTQWENVTPVNSNIQHGPTNDQLDTYPVLDCSNVKVEECSGYSPTPNTPQVCPPVMSLVCLRPPEMPTNATRSTRRVRCSDVPPVILPDVTLNRVPTEMEEKLYLESARLNDKPRAEIFAALFFKRLIPLNTYHNWAGSVNYDGSRGKNALPTNVRDAISDAVNRRFPSTDQNRKLIRDKINELLRKKRKHFPLI